MIPTRIAGIPCLVSVSYSSPRDYVGGPPDNAYQIDDGHFSYEVFDRRGRPAGWLARKVTARDEARFLELA